MSHLLDYLKSNAESNADSIAIETESEQITWANFYSLVTLWANILFTRGINEGKRAGIFISNPIEYSTALYAVIASGATVVALNPGHIRDSIQRSEIDYIITSSKNNLYLNYNDKKYIRIIQIGIELPKIAEVRLTSLNISLKPDEPSFALFSSGTSSEPKLVMHTLQKATRSAELQVAHINMTRLDCLFHSLPLHASFSIALLNTAIVACATLIIRSGFNVSNVIQDNSLKKSTLFACVPTMMIELLHYPITNTSSVFARGSLIISSGAVLPAAVMSDFAHKFGVKVLNLYGSTEALGGIAGTTSHGEYPAGSIGVPYPETELRIVDEVGCDVPNNTTGLLMVKGPHLLDTGFMFTGDLAQQNDEGIYFLMGRATDTIVSGGMNIHPTEVESVILEHPDVLQCVVFPVEDDLFGEVPHAAIVLKQKRDTIEVSREIREYCEQRLSRYSSPKKIVITDRIPVTSVGKMSRRSIARTLYNSF